MELRELSRGEWRERCAVSSIGSPYLDPRWLELVEEVYPRLPIRRLGAVAAGGTPCWLLPLVGVKPLGRRGWLFSSVAFGNEGGFLLPEGMSTVPPGSGELLGAYLDQQGAFALELRTTETYGLGLRPGDPYRRFLLDLPESPESLWDKVLSGNARTGVRKARREGVAVAWNPAGAMADWQGVNLRHAAHHGTPVHHAAWYPAMTRLYAKDLDIAIASRGSEEGIAGAILLHHGSHTVLHALAGRERARQTAAADLVVWEALSRSLSRGCRLFDFGRTRPEPGQLFFKQKWGGRESDFRYAYLVRGKAAIPSVRSEKTGYGLGRALWKCLPLALQRRLGPCLRVRIPA